LRHDLAEITGGTAENPASIAASFFCIAPDATQPALLQHCLAAKKSHFSQ